MLLLLTLVLTPGVGVDGASAVAPPKSTLAPTGPAVDGGRTFVSSTPIRAMAAVGHGLLVAHGPRLVYFDARGVKSTVHTFTAPVALLATDGCRAFVVLERAPDLQVVPLGPLPGVGPCHGVAAAAWPAPGPGPLAIPLDPGSLHAEPKTGRVWLGAHAGVVVWGPDGKATRIDRIGLPDRRPRGWVVDIDLTPTGAVALVEGDDRCWLVPVRRDGGLGQPMEIDPTAEHLDGELQGVVALQAGRSLVTTTAAAHVVEADGRVADTFTPPAHASNGPDAMIPIVATRPGATHLGAGWTVDTLDAAALKQGRISVARRRTLPAVGVPAWARHLVRWTGGLAASWAADGTYGITLYDVERP